MIKTKYPKTMVTRPPNGAEPQAVKMDWNKIDDLIEIKEQELQEICPVCSCYTSDEEFLEENGECITCHLSGD